MLDESTAGPSAALRSGRDDNFSWALASLTKHELSSRPERTRISCHTALDTAACVPFRKERRMKFAEATKFHRKSGGAQWSDCC
jgi:hypothetical protein